MMEMKRWVMQLWEQGVEEDVAGEDAGWEGGDAVGVEASVNNESGTNAAAGIA